MHFISYVSIYLLCGIALTEWSLHAERKRGIKSEVGQYLCCTIAWPLILIISIIVRRKNRK